MEVKPNNLFFKFLAFFADVRFMAIAMFLVVCFQPMQALSAQNSEEDYLEPRVFDAGKIIIDHVLDAYDWHIADVGGVHFSIPLPVILFYEGQWYIFMSSRFDHGHASYKGFAIAHESPGKGRITRVLNDGHTRDEHASMVYDLSITKNVLSIFISGTFLCFLMISLARHYKRRGSIVAPRGLQSLMEPILLFIRDGIALPAIGRKHYYRFLPYLLTLFFFIFFNNILGLVPFFPGGANTTGNISVTMVLALFTFFTIIFNANRGYYKHIFNTPDVPVWLKLPIPLMPIIELTGVFIKPFVLMIRLFANIAAGHMIILGFVSLIFVMGNVSPSLGFAITPLSLAFLIFMNFLELLVAFLQAYVFTLFSAIFLGMAVPEAHH